MTTQTLTADGSKGTDWLQQVIQDKEQLIGKLLNIGISDGGNNRLTFDVGPLAEPGKLSTLAVVAGHPPQESGLVLICFGPIFVDGALRPVAAYCPG